MRANTASVSYAPDGKEAGSAAGQGEDPAGAEKPDVEILPPGYGVCEDITQLKVLIVEDNKFNRQLIKSALSANGIRQYRESGDVEEACRFLETERFDLLILDNMMPGMTGIEFTRAIRRGEVEFTINPNIPIIMVSAFTEEANVREARNSGVHEFVARPFTPDTLIKRIRTTFEHPRKFIRAPGYVGPDRRWRDEGPQGSKERRNNTCSPDALALEAT